MEKLKLSEATQNISQHNNLRKNHQHVAVAVILAKHDENKILISKRHLHQHQGGKWEFPGGKVEPDEDVFSALNRECLEEVNIKIIQARPLCQINHEYPEKTVLLDTWLVTDFSGKIKGCENQIVKWASLSELNNYDFPVPNKKIVLELLSLTKDS